jgi:hypothetical protein
MRHLWTLGAIALICLSSTDFAIGDPANRSTGAKNDFKRDQPCPSTGQSGGACSGYVIDHIIPLKLGGPDNKGNMQWQTIEDAKAKDKIECGGRPCSAR